MDNLKQRVDEMIEINNTITKYTETYIRPSLSDMYAFDVMKSIIDDSINDPDNCEYVMNTDIYGAWSEVLEANTVFSLEFGSEQVYEEVMEWLNDTGHLVFKDDLEEIEDEDESD